MKIALVYDKVVKFGGAERILLSLHEIWKAAPLYTAIYDSENAKWAGEFTVKSSFLDKLPLIRNYQEISTLLTPLAFESFSFSDFDLCLSISSQDAKSIITKPDTLHICYCLTPTRYLWSGYEEYYREPAGGYFNPFIRLGMRLFFPGLRKWDLISSKRPDFYLAISKVVKNRLKEIYGVDSEVVYPPVDIETFKPAKNIKNSGFYLIVSRLVPYKRLDYAIRAFNSMGLKLKVIGSGVDEKRLKNLAGDNIEFIAGDLTDRKLCWYYQNCISLIFPGEEDFGLTPLEAQACGKPVVALGIGGACESVVHGKTGILYDEKTEDSLINGIKALEKTVINPLDCRNNAMKFTKENFVKSISSKIDEYYLKFKNKK